MDDGVRCSEVNPDQNIQSRIWESRPKKIGENWDAITQFYGCTCRLLKGSFTNDVIQKSPFLPPPCVITTQPPLNKKSPSSWSDPPPPPPNFHFFPDLCNMLFKIDINAITGDYRGGGGKKLKRLIFDYVRYERSLIRFSSLIA